MGAVVRAYETRSLVKSKVQRKNLQRGEVSSESIFRDLPRQMFPSSIDQRSMRVFENRLGSSTRGPPDIFSRIKIVLQSRLKRIEEGRAREKKEEEEGNGWKGEKSSSW